MVLELKLRKVGNSVGVVLPKEALAEDVSTRRFADVDNPAIFRTLFNFYVHLGPQFGREIVEIYQRNVRTTYRNRDADMNFMWNAIALKEAELQQKTKETKK